MRNTRIWRYSIWLSLIAGALAAAACMMSMPGERFRAALPPITGPQASLADRLKQSVHVLTIDIGERNVQHPENLERSVVYFESQLRQAGYDAMQIRRQTYDVAGVSCVNLEATVPGVIHPDRVLVVGAHYDSLRGTVGANDNASGSAATLALAESLLKSNPAITVRFLFFVNEEPPYFKRDTMGSLVYARACKARNENIVGMISFDGIGYYSKAPDSQRYPPPMNLFYPSTGDFLGFVGNTASGDLLRRLIEAFRRHADFPSEGVALGDQMPGVSWSDHWSFWQQGYAGVMVTDTLPFRYRLYHSADDTADKLDDDRMARVVEGMHQAIDELSRVNPL